jgi:hypothetical protein
LDSPVGKIELCHFSNTLKLEIFSKLRMAFEKRSLRVPVHRAIREDLHSVNGGLGSARAPACCQPALSPVGVAFSNLLNGGRI